MIRSNEDPRCPVCGGRLKKKDWIKRCSKQIGGVAIDGYVEALASAAEYAGRDLKYIIPDEENSFTAVLNVAILSLSELLYDLDPFNRIDEEEILEELYSEQKRAIDDYSV